MMVLVVDGQGGRIGATLIEQLLQGGCRADLVAVGTNSAATAAMMKAGARQCATGENPVVVQAARADLIVGPIGIIAANSMLGEVTPAMALSISQSPAHKVLVPIERCHITVAGVLPMPMSEYIAAAARAVCACCAQ